MEVMAFFYFVFRWGSPIIFQLQDKTSLSNILISEGDIMQHFHLQFAQSHLRQN